MKVNNLLPEIYYKDSRDFSFIGRLLEIIFNYMKTAADCVATDTLNKNTASFTNDLLADTLGFKSKHKYITKDLIVTISAFSELLRNKGSKDAINLACSLLLTSQGISQQFSGIDIDKQDPKKININISENLKDIILLEDLFDYILPVGVIYTFTKVADENVLQNSTFSVKTSKQEIQKGFDLPDAQVKSDNPIGFIPTADNNLNDKIKNEIGNINTGMINNRVMEETNND